MMAEISGRSENGMKRMKQKLLEHFDDSTFFTEVGGCDNVVCFRNMAKHVINEKWYKGRKDSIEDEAERLVVAAAKLIKANIKADQHWSGYSPNSLAKIRHNSYSLRPGC